MQVFIYSYQEDVAGIFFFYFNKISNMFLNKVQQSDCYTQLCNYREEFVFKTLNLLYTVVTKHSCGLQFKFH